MHQTWRFPPIGFVSPRRQPADELASSPLFREFRATGRFWLPNSEEQDGWSGEILYRPGDAPRVILNDFPPRDNSRRGIPVPILLGRLADGSCCTVIDGEGWIETYFGPQQHHRATIFANQVLGGVHLHHVSSPVICSLQCRFTHVDELFGSPYRVDHDRENRRSSVQFNPSTLEIPLAYDEVPFTLSVFCARSIPFEMRPNGDDWQYNHTLIIRPSTPQALAWFTAVAILVRRCLVFLIGSACYTTELSPSFKGTDESNINEIAGELFHPISVPTVLRKNPHYFSTSPGEIADILPGVLSVWFRNHSRLDSVARAYSDILSNEGSYEESIFLGVVQILEYFHGIIFPDEARYLGKAEWKKIVKELGSLLPSVLKASGVPEAAAEEQAKLLVSRIGFLSRISLQTKLEQLFSRARPWYFVPLLNNPGDPEATIGHFASQVAGTRHFLTHYSEAEHANAFDALSLQKATASCWAVLTYWLARELGIEDQRAGRMARQARKAMFIITERSGL